MNEAKELANYNDLSYEQMGVALAQDLQKVLRAYKDAVEVDGGVVASRVYQLVSSTIRSEADVMAIQTKLDAGLQGDLRDGRLWKTKHDFIQKVQDILAKIPVASVMQQKKKTLTSSANPKSPDPMASGMTPREIEERFQKLERKGQEDRRKIGDLQDKADVCGAVILRLYKEHQQIYNNLIEGLPTDQKQHLLSITDGGKGDQLSQNPYLGSGFSASAASAASHSSANSASSRPHISDVEQNFENFVKGLFDKDGTVKEAGVFSAKAAIITKAYDACLSGKHSKTVVDQFKLIVFHLLFYKTAKTIFELKAFLEEKVSLDLVASNLFGNIDDKDAVQKAVLKENHLKEAQGYTRLYPDTSKGQDAGLSLLPVDDSARKIFKKIGTQQATWQALENEYLEAYFKEYPNAKRSDNVATGPTR